MGDPKKFRKKYKGPTHPWQKERIVEEKELKKEYGLKNKTEIWKMTSSLRRYADQAKKLVAATGKQAELEAMQLLKKVKRQGLLPEEGTIGDILSLTVREVMERRLQTQVYKKNLARSMDQARQFITHNHIMIGDKIITSPSYIVKIEEEFEIKFVPKSQLSDPEHPERQIKSESKVSKEAEAEEEKPKKKEAKGKPKKEQSKKEEPKKEKEAKPKPKASTGA